MADPYIPDAYFPTGYFPTGYFTSEAEAVLTYALTTQELDLRLYSAAGTRKYFDQSLVKELDFELSEKGGYLNGTLTLAMDWEDLTLTGTEYFDVFCYGERVYRGYVQIREQNIDSPEEVSLTLSGRAETLNGYIVRRCFCYGTAVDISQVFLDICEAYVQSSGRLTSIVLSAIGVPSLEINVKEFCAKGKSVSQALSALCDVAPNQLIWGCDVDDTGADRLYLLPRTEAVAYRYVIGKNVNALVYPQDRTEIVNKLYVTGGEADPPNLCPNPSFEACLAGDEASANLLLNNSFESGTGRNADSWNRGYDACRRVFPDDGEGRSNASNLARTGSAWVEMDNIWDGSPEDFTQNDVNIGYAQTINMSVWARQITNGDTERFRFQLLVWNGSGTLLETLNSAEFIPTSDVMEHFECSLTPTSATTSEVSYRVQMMSAGGVGKGVLYDDAALWLGSPQASDWQAGTSSNAYFATLDWRNESAPYEGEINVKAQAVITGGGGYAELNLRDDSRISVDAGKVYYVSAYFKAVSASADVRVGIREYEGATILATTVQSASTTVASSGWTRVQFSVTTNVATTRLEPVIRFYDADAVYVDAVMITKATVPATFYPSKNFEATKSVTDYTSGQVGADAVASITDWGLREKEETQETITDSATLDAFCISYFQAHAVPKIQGKLVIQDPASAAELPAFEGTIQIQNLTSAPDPLFPARIRYRFGETLRIDVDLNNERPDLAQLLRKVAVK